jgi:hypothetical protein
MRGWTGTGLVFLLWLASGGLLFGQPAPAMTCTTRSATVPVVPVEGLSPLVADLVLDCTGGVPTPPGQTLPSFTFTITFNANVTSRLLGPDWTEALLLIDEPQPGSQFPCDGSGFCPGFGNGKGTGYYGAGAQSANTPNNRNVFQAPISGAANSLTWARIPVDPPGSNRRTFRFTNMRVNANQAGVGNILALISANGNFPIAGSTVTVANVQNTLSAGVRDAGNTTAAANGVPVPISTAASVTRFATLRFAEAAVNIAKPRTVPAGPFDPNQDVPGVTPTSESGFFNSSFGTFGVRGNLGTAGLADAGTRYRALISNIPAGVSVFVDVTNNSSTAGATAQLTSTDPTGAGGFTPVSAASTAQLGVINGAASAVWEVTRADPAQLDTFNFGVYLSYPANFAGAPPVPVTVQLSYAPINSTAASSTSAPVPRFTAAAGTLPLFTFIGAPTLSATPAALSFTAMAGGADPSPQSLVIGSTTTTAPATVTLTTGGALAIGLGTTNGSTPLTTSVSVSVRNLLPGQYNGTITVIAAGAPNIPLTVPVSLTVTPGVPVITTLAPSAVTAGGPAFNLAIAGLLFSSGATVQVGTANLTPTNLSSTNLTVSVPANLIAAAGSLPVKVTNPGGLVSNTLNLAVNAGLTITTLSPNTVTAGGPAFNLTVTGTGFVTGITAQVGGSTLTPTNNTATQFVVTVPASLIATARSLTVTVTVPGGVVSNPLTLTVAGFAITSISPTSVTATRTAFLLTINGTGFAAGAGVKAGSSTIAPASLSATQITVNVPASAVAQPATVPVSVVQASGATSNIVNLTVNPVPAITSLVPASAQAGGAAFVLTVQGADFLSGYVVQWNGQPLSTTFGSANQLTAQVPANLIATAGTAGVTVSTADGVGSGSANFTIVGPPPAISGLNPNSVTVGTQNVSLSVNGSGFVSQSVVLTQSTAGGAVTLTPDSVTPTLITVKLADTLLGQPDAVTVRVMNPDGATSAPSTLNIVLPPLGGVSFTGPATSDSGLDQNIAMAVGGAFPVDLTVRLDLVFVPDGSLPNDPAIQFQNGTRSMTIAVPANTQPQLQATVKTGTVAGVITVTPTFTAGGVNVTPSGVPVQRIQVARAAPVIASLDCVRASNTSINLIMDGHTNTRTAAQSTFDLQGAAGANLGTSQLQAPVTSIFAAWFTGAAQPAGNMTAGGTFRYVQTLNVQGNAPDLGSVTGRISNEVGTSAPRSAACHAQ